LVLEPHFDTDYFRLDLMIILSGQR
jgi:hypothetical protein